MNPYSPPATAPAEKTLTQRRSLDRPRNPARYLFWPLGILSTFLSLASVATYPVGGKFFLPNLAVCLVVSSFGVAALMLAAWTYTATSRVLTILWTFMSLCGMYVTLTVDPPSGGVDTLFAIATVLVFLSIGVLAAFYVPKPPGTPGEHRHATESVR